MLRYEETSSNIPDFVQMLLKQGEIGLWERYSEFNGMVCWRRALLCPASGRIDRLFHLVDDSGWWRGLCSKAKCENSVYREYFHRKAQRNGGSIPAVSLLREGRFIRPPC